MAEAAAVLLRHVTFVTTGKAFVTGGHTVPVREGVAEVSLREPLDLLTLWYDGYRIDAETGKEIRNPGDLDAFIAAHTPKPEPEPEVDEDDEETVKVDQFVEALTDDAEADPED